MALQTQTTGEFAGWQFWDNDSFENGIGPFFFRKEEDGSYVGAFRAEQRHMNGNDSMHGGCMMSFADFGLFVIPHDLMTDESGVTMTMNSEFLSGARAGSLMEVRGEVTRAGKSVMFIRGQITSDGTPCLNFSGTIKRFRKS